MRRSARVLTALAALGVGGVVGRWTQPAKAPRADARPAPVERVVKALDRLNSAPSAEFTTALEAAGAPANYASPWREELEMATIVAQGDRPALQAFATAPRPCPARARAWLRLSADASDALARIVALDELSQRYPESAAARVYRARAAGTRR